LLLEVVNGMPELLVLGFAVVDCGIVEAAMESTPVVKYCSLLAGWIEPEGDAAGDGHDASSYLNSQ